LTDILPVPGLFFPRRSNQRLNSYLTELAAICGINKPLSTIVARHTFATLMLTKGMPLESVSHIMGHSNTKTTAFMQR
jgi:site-specific recombinase XerD